MESSYYLLKKIIVKYFCCIN